MSSRDTSSPTQSTMASLLQTSFLRNKIFTSILELDTMIPTTSAITAAKSKRDHLRKHGGGTGDDSGFISLDVAKMPSKKGESRLVREEDEIGEGDDGRVRSKLVVTCILH
jgi:Nineteen complex-related protein 2